MDKKSIANLLAEVAKKYPDKYEQIAKTISDLGRKASYLQGETLTLSDTEPVIDRERFFARMDAELDAARKALPRDEYERKRLEIWGRYSDLLTEETKKAALAKGSNLAYTVISGARGSPTQLKMMVTTPSLYLDAQDNVVPLFVRHSFGDGLRPAEYLAGSYGARKAVLATKRATAKGGDLAKQMVQVATPLIITEKDCGVGNGLDFDIEEKSLRNRVLAETTAGLPAGTVLDRQALNHLRKAGQKKIIARSPMTCQAKAGLCSKCVGVDATGHFPPLGEAVGVTGAQSVSEPITQGALNCLAEGTEVLMADYSVKPIEQIRPGEYVMGSDLNGKIFPTRVTHTWDQGMQPVQRRSYKMGQTKQIITLDSTYKHPVLQNRKTYGKSGNGKNNNKAEKLIAGYKHSNIGAVIAPGVNGAQYELRNSDPFYRAKRISEEELGMMHCYDITVEHEDSLFVLANGLIVSNTKHSGGAAQGSAKVYSGFDVINRFVQTPEEFPDKAIVSTLDGRVNKVYKAPQGGHFVEVGEEKHYIPHNYPVLVKVGDNVEAGDQLSEGLVDPGDIVELRGLGEGRRYYADRLSKILDDSGMPADRRNTEILARAALDHIQVGDVDEDDPYLPDDVVSYSYLSRNYEPPEDTRSYDTDKAIGKYLQRPVLHYTIGTRITPSVAKRLKDVGKTNVYASERSPEFKPHMVRLRTSSHANRDWLAGMNTSYLKKNLLESAIRGDDTNVKENTNFSPRLAYGVDFGRDIEETGKF